ncbi:hypothetical protein Emed_005865 [Eimeria media]
MALACKPGRGAPLTRAPIYYPDVYACCFRLKGLLRGLHRNSRGPSAEASGGSSILSATWGMRKWGAPRGPHTHGTGRAPPPATGDTATFFMYRGGGPERGAPLRSEAKHRVARGPPESIAKETAGRDIPDIHPLNKINAKRRGPLNSVRPRGPRLCLRGGPRGGPPGGPRGSASADQADNH